MIVVQIAGCDIGTLATNRQAAETACLGAEERRRLAAAPLRRLAGVIAVKRAVLQLTCQPADPHAVGYDEHDVRIGHDADGAPRLDGVPQPLRPALAQQRLHISISHTGDHAFGLAALAGDV